MDRREREEMFERLVVGVEKLSEELPQSDFKALPPVCPSCRAFDPQITLAFQEGGTGRMSEIVVNGECQCGAKVYIVIDSYSVHNTLDTVEVEIKEREKAGFFQ